MNTASFYKGIRMTHLLVAGLTLPLAMFSLASQTDFLTPLSWVGGFILLMIWAMFFIAFDQSTYPVNTDDALTYTGGNLIALGAYLWLLKADWLYGFYSSFYVSFATLVIFCGFLFFYGLLYRMPGKESFFRKIPWWGFLIAFFIMVFSAFYTIKLGRPFYAKIIEEKALWEKIGLVLSFLFQGIIIFAHLFGFMVREKEISKEKSELWGQWATITAVIMIVSAVFALMSLFSKTVFYDL